MTGMGTFYARYTLVLFWLASVGRVRRTGTAYRNWVSYVTHWRGVEGQHGGEFISACGLGSHLGYNA